MEGAPYLLNSLDRLDKIGKGDYLDDVELDDLPEDERHECLRQVRRQDGTYYSPGKSEARRLPRTRRESADEGIFQCKSSSCCKSTCSQKFCNLPVFVMSYGVTGIWMIMTGTLLGSQITSIQRHLGLTSTSTGLLLSGNDIGQLVMVLIGSHFGKYTHIPRCLALSGMVFGLATLAMSFGRLENPKVVLHGSSGMSNVTNGTEADRYLCTSKDLDHVLNSTTPATTVTPVGSSSGAAVSWAYWLLFFGALVAGSSKSYRIPLLTYYVESNVSNKRWTPLLLGSSFTAMVLGPPFALFLGSFVSSLPFDLEETSMSHLDQRWIGAWWLGLLIVGSACIITSIPIIFFPRRLRRRKRSSIPHMEKTRRQSSVVSTAEPTVDSEEEVEGCRGVIFDLFKSISRMFRRPVYCLILTSTCVSSLAWSGHSVFGQKYTETQFNKSSREVSMAVGIATLLSLATGTFLGGILTTKFKLEMRGCIIVTLLITVATIMMGATRLFLGCDNTEIVGLTTDTGVSDSCYCEPRNNLLSCGDDGRDYLSPCIAGCTNVTDRTYKDCSVANVTSMSPGLCELDCPFFIPYIVSNFIEALISCSGIVPKYMITIRSVELRDQSLATGFSMFCGTIFGFLPSPPLFGHIVDSTCMLWSQAGGFCILHDRELFRFRFVGLGLGLQSFDIFVIGAMVCYILHQGRRSNVFGKR